MRLTKWFKEEIFGLDLLLYISTTVLLVVVYETAFAILFPVLYKNISVGCSNSSYAGSIPVIVLIYIPLAALFEELLFRLIPLSLAICKSKTPEMVLFAIISSSFLFGMLHGNVFRVIIEGVVGVILSVLFLKCGAYQKKFFKATMCSTAAHYALNIFVMLSVMFPKK